ncbi:MAG: exodeoxyribonuclease VII large subunit [Chloroflexota bacterium]|nr:exodeoxyribonuclease VII large subunit [Chloroflexota bacterium]MDE2682601.1 exodeoxyribonuclease VII large subunit [Chloroflexota bacterium]
MLSPVVYSVGEVATYLKDKLESDGVLSRLTVQGEVANLRTVASGHSYFSLREDGSTIRCVMFRGRSGQEYLEEGHEVLAGGNFTFYAPYGEANMQVAAVLPVGEGAMALELARLRQQLAGEGLFEASRKRPPPLFPKVIGVVTSPSGAVWQDIQNVARRRYPLVELRLSPTAVQGDAAGGQIAEAIKQLNDEGLADVIIVARGGGSLEDLWCFNSEEVARAIFGSGIPVVSGVGHETDHTIADDVADQRAPTPSAAAELATPDRRQLLANVFAAGQQLTALMLGQIDRRRGDVKLQRQRLQRRGPDVAVLMRQIDGLTERATAAMTRRKERLQRDLEAQQAKLSALDPAATLRRGYAVVSLSAKPGALTAPEQARDGDLLDITLSGGGMQAVAGNSPVGPSAAQSEPVKETGANNNGNGAAKPTPSSTRRRRGGSAEAQPAMRPLL